MSQRTSWVVAAAGWSVAAVLFIWGEVMWGHSAVDASRGGPGIEDAEEEFDRLRQANEQLQASNDALRRRLEDSRSPLPQQPAARRPDDNGSQPAAADAGPPEIPQAILDAGRLMHVPRDVLELAFKAHLQKGSQQAMKELAKHGAVGCRAVLALLRGGANGTWFDNMIAATWSPELESEYVALLDDPATPEYALWSALSATGRLESDRLRKYVLARVSSETDPGLFMSAAQALGRMGETGGAWTCENKLFRRSWGGVRTEILHSLGQMGGAKAKQILIDYLRDPRATEPAAALRSLSRIDPVAARAEARTVLDGPKEALIKFWELDTIKKIAGR